MTPADTAREVKAKALALGFDAVGVAESGALDRDADALARWLGCGRHASMTWMAETRRQRIDPGRFLTGCRSVVSVAMNYYPSEARAPLQAGRAKVALYAHGRDYHKVLGRRLEVLAAWLSGRTGCVALGCVDTGPVLERAWAERAGIGWIGKNANLISRGRGSWLLLGEVLTTAEIEPDPGPHADFCGTCRACIDACPTGAILEPGVVDSRRCVSYWTIEHRGAVPHEHRSALGDWIFGCDDCQTACPWNHSFASPRRDDPFNVRKDLADLDLVEVLCMDEGAFRSRYSGTSLMRAKWQGMRRNACIVLGNRGDHAAVPALDRALTDPDAIVRAHAAWALARLRTLPQSTEGTYSSSPPPEEGTAG